MRRKWLVLSVGWVVLTMAGRPGAAPVNVALGGVFLADGGWWQGGTTQVGDGVTGDYTGPQGGWTQPNRLFGVRLPGLATVDSVQLYITGGPGGRMRPENVRLYYQGGYVDLVLPNANSVVALPVPIQTPWLLFRELSTYANNGDANYFINEIQAWDNSGTPVDTGGWANRVNGPVTGPSPLAGGSAALIGDGNYFGSGAFYAIAEFTGANGTGPTFTVPFDGSAPIRAVSLVQELFDSTTNDRVAYNTAREITLRFNDPANTTFTIGNLGAQIADGANYDNGIPGFYQLIELPAPVIGASQVIVTLTRQDPETAYGAGPFTPTLPIGTRTTWGLAGVDNNRWGVIEFEVLSLPEPGTAALLLLGGALFLHRRRR
jgi:hypothetical protein